MLVTKHSNINKLVLGDVFVTCLLPGEMIPFFVFFLQDGDLGGMLKAK